MPRLLRPQKLCLDMRGQSLPASIRSATLSFFIAAPLQVIAQRKLDLFPMTILFSSTNSEPIITYRDSGRKKSLNSSPACPEINQPCNPDASQAYLLCSHDIHYMAQLTSNTDNKDKKLVMFFAGASLLSIKHTVRGYYRDCAAALNKTCVRGVFTCFQLPLYRDTRKTQNIPGLAKNTPCLAYYGLRSFVLI